MGAPRRLPTFIRQLFYGFCESSFERGGLVIRRVFFISFYCSSYQAF